MARRAKEFRKPPYFKFNVADWLSDPWVRRMSAEQRGWYISLLTESWNRHHTCYLENDAESIEMAAGLKLDSDAQRDIDEIERFRKTSRIVLDRFEATPEGKYIFNARMLREYEDLLAERLHAKRGGLASAKKLTPEQRSERSRKAAETRWLDKPSDANRMLTDANQTETRDRDKRQETEKSSSSAASAEPIAGTLPLIDGTDYQVTRAEEAMWQGLFPAVEVKQAFRNMKAWLIAHEKNRKTPRGIKKFIQGWLSREQDSARPGAGNGTGTSKAAERKSRIQAANRVAFREIVGGAFDDGGGIPAGDGAGAESTLGEVVEILPNRDD